MDINSLNESHHIQEDLYPKVNYIQEVLKTKIIEIGSQIHLHELLM